MFHNVYKDSEFKVVATREAEEKLRPHTLWPGKCMCKPKAPDRAA